MKTMITKHHFCFCDPPGPIPVKLTWDSRLWDSHPHPAIPGASEEDFTLIKLRMIKYSAVGRKAKTTCRSCFFPPKSGKIQRRTGILCIPKLQYVGWCQILYTFNNISSTLCFSLGFALHHTKVFQKKWPNWVSCEVLLYRSDGSSSISKMRSKYTV